jgi:hypothetical protein
MTRRSALFERSMPTGSNNSTTVIHKDKERHELAELLASFRKSGGEIEVLGITRISPNLTRRQINEARAPGRNRPKDDERPAGAATTLATVTPPCDLRTQLHRKPNHA